MKYDNIQISNELFDTAQTNAYFGNSLRVAKDIPGMTPEEISVLERYLTGRNIKGDRFRLQDISIKVGGFTHD